MTRIRTALIGCGKVGADARGRPRLPRAVGARRGLRPDAWPAPSAFARPVSASGRSPTSRRCCARPTSRRCRSARRTRAHADAIEVAAAHGVHVLVEKPLAATLADCDRAIAACAAAGVQLGVISQRRFYPPILRMKAAIDAGRIGRPALATVDVLGWRDAAYYASNPWRGTWAGEGGGVLVNQAPHQLDLLLWLMGPVEELFGYWDNLNHPGIEVDDTAVAVIRFRGGGLGDDRASATPRTRASHGRIHVHGSNGASIGTQTDFGSMFISGVTTSVEPPVNDLWTIDGEAGPAGGAGRREDRAFGGATSTS